MAINAQNGGQKFVLATQTVNSGAYYTSPVATYPQTYALLQAQQSPAPGRYDVSFCKKSAIWLGVVLLICGVASQAGAAIALRVFAAFAEVGEGFWGGNMFIAAGAVAIAAGHHRTKNLITGTAVTSAIAAAAAATQIGMATYGLCGDLLDYTCYNWCEPGDDIYCICNYDNWETLAIAGNSTMIGAGSLALIGATWLLVIACIALCRKSTSFQVHSVPQVAISKAIDSSQVHDHHEVPKAQSWHQQDNKSSMPLNHPPPNSTSPPTSSQDNEYHEAPAKYDVEKL